MGSLSIIALVSSHTERLAATKKENLGLPRFTGIDLPAPPKPVAVQPVPAAVAGPPAAGAVPPIGQPHALPPFAMTPQEHVKYHGLFQSYDLNHDGYLSRDESLPIFQKSGLDMARVEVVFAIADEDKDGQLSSKEFCAAFHIIVCVT